MSLKYTVLICSLSAPLLSAGTIVQTQDLSGLLTEWSAASGDPFPGSVQVPALSATFNPYAGNPGDLVSFTVEWSLTFSGTQLNSVGGSGGGISVSASGTFYFEDMGYNGNIYGNGNGGGPGQTVNTSFMVSEEDVFLAANAGSTYNPAILSLVTGTDPFELNWGETGGAIGAVSPSVDVDSFSAQINPGSYVRLTYEAVPEPSATFLCLLGTACALRRRR
ncbi:MAG: PEP-CTERM sorting domain-containing protein [Verrucomicrobiales bacterium]